MPSASLSRDPDGISHWPDHFIDVEPALAQNGCSEMEMPEASSGCLTNVFEEPAKRADHPVVPLAQQRREDVFADLLPPQMIAAVTPRYRARVKIHPVLVIATSHQIATLTDPIAAKAETPFQTTEVHAPRRIEIDRNRSCLLHSPRLSSKPSSHEYV
jgi:hypothetical protein